MSEKAPSFFLQINSKILQRYSRMSVYFSKPCLLRLYDIEDGKICPAKKLQYFRDPKLSEYPLDLNDSDEEEYPFFKIPNETKTLMALKHEITSLGSKSAIEKNGRYIDRTGRTSVYTRRCILRYIMAFCYSGKYDSNILISRYGGKLYLFKIDGELDFATKPLFLHHSRLCRHLFVDEPNGLPNFDEPYHIFDTKHILHRSNLGKFDITYSGGVRGIISDVKIEEINDINALKKKRFALVKQMWLGLKNNDWKYLKYWIEGYLANVEDLYMAYKDKKGVVRQPIEHLKVSNIPNNRRWKPVVCTGFLYEFLERVEQLMWNVNSFETVYEFHFNGQDKTIHYEIHTGKPEKIAIPKEYIEFAKKQSCF